MAGTARNLNQAGTRERRARSAATERSLALPHDAAATISPGGEAGSQLASSSGRMIDRWRRLPPHVRRGCVGAGIALLGIAGYTGLVVRGDQASPLAPIGQLWHAFAGWGAYPLATLLVVAGILQIAESLARRPLLRPYLFAVALALWLVAEAGIQLFWGHAQAGMLGALLTAPLGRLPLPLARALVVVVGVALAVALAGVGPAEAPRLIGGLARRLSTRTLALIRPTPAAKRQAATSSRTASASRSQSIATPAITTRGARANREVEEPPAKLLLPTAGFPQLEIGAVDWELPSLELFDAPMLAAPPAPGLVEAATARLSQALRALRLEAEVRREDVTLGPTTIRLGIRPAERPRRDARGYALVARDGQPLMERAPVSDILRAQRDLAAALGVRQVRMEAPTPETPFVVIEIPRPDPRPVSLYEIVLSDAFQQMAAGTRLALALGRNARGQARALDLATTPHLLLAGAEEMGARHALHALLASLLVLATPDDARLLLLDPRRATLAAYDDLPHLLMPVVAQPLAAGSALRRAIEEAERRSQLFARLGVRTLAEYQHLAWQDDELEWLPAIIVAVAEVGDLLAISDAERSLTRLAQLGRATGFSLLLATERPGALIHAAALKALVSARLGFAVATSADSRAMLEVAGAECLIGRGDALLLTGAVGRAERIQTASASAEEIARLARFWRRQVPPARPASGGFAPSDIPIRDQSAIRGASAPLAWSRASEEPAGGIMPREAPPPASWLPPLRRRAGHDMAPRDIIPEEPRALAWSGAPADRARGRHPQRESDEHDALPEGWTDEMLEDMMRQIRSVIAQGRSPYPPATERNWIEGEE